MKAIGVIPARYGATRFPGKILTPIAGQSLLSWVIAASQSAESLSDLIVATDDVRIQEEAENCGVKVVMTSKDLVTGTDRVWEAVKNMECDVVLNIQGDEPLLKGEVIDTLVEQFQKNSQIQMATLGRKLKKGDLESQTTAKIVLNNQSEAIYFSRFPIPYSRNDWVESSNLCLKHIGIYGFQKSFLKEYCESGSSELERAEGLEQLRALYLGAKIRVAQVEFESWGVDTPEDVLKVEKLMSQGRGK